MALTIQKPLVLNGLHREEAEVLALLKRLAVDLELGEGDGGSLGQHIYRLAGIADLADQLHAHPATRIARHGDGVQAELEELDDAGRVKDRDAVMREGVFLLDGEGRALRFVVFAAEHDDGAVGAGAHVVAVPEGVAGTVHARALAVPDPDHPVVSRMRVVLEHLRAHHRARGQLLVLPGLMHQAEVGGQWPGRGERQVKAAQRRAGVAAHE